VKKRLRKLQRDPVAFFRDARFGWLAGPLPGILARPKIHAAMLDPAEALAGVPIVSRLIARSRAASKRARLETLRRHGSPRVSVVMAARNAESTIARAVSSILSQSYENLELVVVDDASTDGTLDACRRAAANDPRVTIAPSREHHGVAWCRNVGLSRATGEYVTFQDADDASHPERIERQLAALIERPEAVFCVCNYRREDARGRPIVINGHLVKKSLISMLFRREQVLRAIGYFSDLRISEETEYFERMKTVFGEDAEVHLFETLYFARFATTSLLFSDGELSIRTNGSVKHERSADADRVLSEVRAKLREIRSGASSPYVAFEAPDV
jgi:glycosyltransferase involved in cell wall biosynthesis